jgi:hypothetical protein
VTTSHQKDENNDLLLIPLKWLKSQHATVGFVETSPGAPYVAIALLSPKLFIVSRLLEVLRKNEIIFRISL